MRITGYDNQSNDVGYTVEFEGKAYTYEVWAFENASGADWRFEGEGIVSPWDGRDDSDALDEAFQQLVDRFDETFYTAWRAEVQPVIDRITERAVTLSNADIICGRCKTLIQRDEHGSWVDITGGDGCDDAVHDPNANKQVIIRGAVLTDDDLHDLRQGLTINAMRPDSSEVTVTPADLEAATD